MFWLKEPVSGQCLVARHLYFFEKQDLEYKHAAFDVAPEPGASLDSSGPDKVMYHSHVRSHSNNLLSAARGG